MILTTSSMRMRRKPLTWVIALPKRAGKRARRKRAGKRARRKTKLLTNAGTTAEGVETDQQRDTVQMLGCTQMQGYLFSRPVPAQDVRTLLAAEGVEDAA